MSFNKVDSVMPDVKQPDIEVQMSESIDSTTQNREGGDP